MVMWPSEGGRRAGYQGGKERQEVVVGGDLAQERSAGKAEKRIGLAMCISEAGKCGLVMQPSEGEEARVIEVERKGGKQPLVRWPSRGRKGGLAG